MKLKSVFYSALLIIPFGGALANGWEDLGTLDGRVVALTGAGVGQAGGPSAPIDPRIRLAKCPQTPSFDQAGGDAVAIRCAALGWRIRVPLVAAVKNSSEAAAILVRRGDVVELIYEGVGFAAISSGTAMDDGPKGKTIRVKTSSSGVPVTAMVSAAGEVRIAR